MFQHSSALKARTMPIGRASLDELSLFQSGEHSVRPFSGAISHEITNLPHQFFFYFPLSTSSFSSDLSRLPISDPISEFFRLSPGERTEVRGNPADLMRRSPSLCTAALRGFSVYPARSHRAVFRPLTSDFRLSTFYFFFSVCRSAPVKQLKESALD